MAFDLSTARQYKPRGFDVSSARVAGTRQKAEEEAAAANARIAAGHKGPGVGEQLLRSTAQTLTGLGRGNPLVAIPAALEEGVDAAVDFVPGATGVPRNRDLPRFFRGPMDLLSPPELAPRNPVEQIVSTGAEFVGGAVGGTGIGREVAERLPGTVAGKVGEALADMPGRQLLGAGTGTAALEATRAAGGGPLAQTIAGTVGAGAAFAGAKPPNIAADVTPNGAPLRPFGPAVETARRLDYRVTPEQVTAKAQMEAPMGTTGERAPGMLRSTFTGPGMPERFAIDNQKRTNAFAAKDLGISEVSDEALELAKYPHNAVYNEVARATPQLTRDAELTAAAEALGAARRDNPYLRNTAAVDQIRDRLLSADVVDTQKALDAIREYRKDARTAFQKVGDVEAEQAAIAYRQAADALERAIERQSPPGLVERLREARTKLAKIHNYQDALDGSNVDAARLAKIGEKFPLSGFAADIAEVATNFPETMRSATGISIPQSSNQSMFTTASLFARRMAGREQIPYLMSDSFQNRYGRADPNYVPGAVEESPFAPAAPPAAPPPDGRFPWSPAGEGPLDVLPDPTGVPFEGSQLPVQAPAELSLAEDLIPTPKLPPSMDRKAAGVALEGPLDGPDLRGPVPGYDALPFSQDVGAPPVVPTPPDAMLRGEIDARPIDDLGFELQPDPVANPDIVPGAAEPMQPRVKGDLDLLADFFNLGGDTVPFELPLPDPDAGGLSLRQAGPDTIEPDFGPADTRGKSLNPNRRNLPRAGGRGTRAEDLELDQELVPEEPLALPAPTRETLIGSPQGDVGLAQDFEDFGLGTPGARRAAREGELLDPDAPGPQGETPVGLDDELTLEDSAPREVAPEFTGGDTPALGADEFEIKGDNRRIILRESEGRLNIQRTNVDEKVQAKGLGQQNIMDALAEAEKRGLPLDGGITMTRAALRPWRSLERKGAVEFDGNLDEIERAIEANGGITKERPDGKPWITNIRRGPAG